MRKNKQGIIIYILYNEFGRKGSKDFSNEGRIRK
jgi:hypothetical protein